MSLRVRPLVAIGVGNILLGDDAVGVRVIEGLRAAAGHDPGIVPAGTELVDGGTLGPDLLRFVRDARGLVFVDAVRLGGPAGRVSVLDVDALDAVGGSSDGSPGSVVGELIALARVMGWLPEPVAMVGIEVDDLAFGRALTPAVAAAIPAAMDAVRDELRRMDDRPMSSITGGGATAMAGARA